MLFKTPLAFAVVAAISTSLMALLGGLFALGIHLGLVHFAVIRAVSYFNLFGLVVFVAVVFVLTLPIETVYARRTLFGEDRSSNAMSGFLLFPVAVAIPLWRLFRMKAVGTITIAVGTLVVLYMLVIAFMPEWMIVGFRFRWLWK